MTPFFGQATKGVAHWAYQVTFICYTSQIVAASLSRIAIRGHVFFFLYNLYVNSTGSRHLIIVVVVVVDIVSDK